MSTLTSEKRFSKRKMIEHLERRLQSIQAEHNFDPTNGYVQVRGRGDDKNRAYGEYSMLRDLLSRVRDGWL